MNHQNDSLKWPKVLWVFLASSFPMAAATQLPPAAKGNVDYTRDVKPLLAEHCYKCHGSDAQLAGLRLDLRQNALRGGDYGPVIVPGKSAESKLIRKLVDGDGGEQMPSDAEPLSSEDIGTLRAWIDQGADFRNDVPDEAPPQPIEPKLAALITAVRSAPRPEVEKLLAANPELLSARDPANSTLLHHAAGFGRLDTMTWLIDAGAAVNATNRRGSTPLHWAIHDEAKVRHLLARGASVNARQAEGRTPLYQAATLGNGYPILRLLLDHGADSNSRIANKRTPLMAAAERGDVKALRLLLDAKADVNARNGAGETALMLAASSGSPPAVRLLLERGADTRVRTKRDETALGNAGTAGNDTVVRLLLEHGAEVNTRNIRGYSPLMLAASSDTRPAALVKRLLAHGADQTFTGDYDESARELAAKRGPSEVTRLLGGPSPNPRGSDGITAGKTARELTAARDAGHRSNGPIPDAVGRALRMTEKQSFNFIRIGGCNSCHSQDLPSAAAAFARSRGLDAPREIPQLPASMMPSPERIMDLDFVTVSSRAWELFDFGMNGVAKNHYTDAVVRLIEALQTEDGHWSAIETRRPPMGVGEFQAAALAIYSIQHYAPSGDDGAGKQAVDRAVAWLGRAKPETTQDRAFQALGLAWGGADPKAIARAVRPLAAMQRADGGWSQLPDLESDAYATGQALYALHTAARMPATDPVYQKGVEYLLRTQATDGTWRVKSRSIWLQPYFESGFPYGRDQFISTAGTAWAAMALAAATPPTTLTRR
jgi:ankyrin repeat protein/mono/diheme cytochrome c family protein